MTVGDVVEVVVEAAAPMHEQLVEEDALRSSLKMECSMVLVLMCPSLASTELLYVVVMLIVRMTLFACLIKSLDGSKPLSSHILISSSL